MIRNPRFTKTALLAAAGIALLLVGALTDNRTPYQRAVDSCVYIEAGGGHGSGVFVAPDLVLTAAHVVAGARDITAYSPDRFDGAVITSPAHYEAVGGMACTVVAINPTKDLALLRVKGHGKSMRLARASSEPGDRVFAIGSGDALFGYSGGDVRQVYPTTQDFPDQRFAAACIEASSAINLGDSGGPLVDDRGELAGVCCYIDTGRSEAYFAVDVSEIRAFLEGVGR